LGALSLGVSEKSLQDAELQKRRSVWEGKEAEFWQSCGQKWATFRHFSSKKAPRGHANAAERDRKERQRKKKRKKREKENEKGRKSSIVLASNQSGASEKRATVATVCRQLHWHTLPDKRAHNSY